MRKIVVVLAGMVLLAVSACAGDGTATDDAVAGSTLQTAGHTRFANRHRERGRGDDPRWHLLTSGGP